MSTHEQRDALDRGRRWCDDRSRDPRPAAPRAGWRDWLLGIAWLVGLLAITGALWWGLIVLVRSLF